MLVFDENMLRKSNHPKIVDNRLLAMGHFTPSDSLMECRLLSEAELQKSLRVLPVYTISRVGGTQPHTCR